MLVLLLPLGTAQAQEVLRVTLAEGPLHSGRVYNSAAGAQTPTLTVINGQQAIWQKSSGRDYQLQAAPHSWSWTQVQQVTQAETSIAVTPQREGDKVSVKVDYFVREGDQSVSYSSTVAGAVGEWIPLLQPTNDDSHSGSKVYRAGDLSQQLSLKVEPGR